jgi:putative ABC transport system ATP-binding protein
MQVGDVTVSALGRASLRRIRRRMVGYVFQRPGHNLIPHLTVGQHLAVAARLRGPGDRWAVDELLSLLGLEGRIRHLPHQLSGGEQQRVAFAQAVIGRQALVADEPTAELDSATGERLLETVASLASLGTSFVVSTSSSRRTRSGCSASAGR